MVKAKRCSPVKGFVVWVWSVTKERVKLLEKEICILHVFGLKRRNQAHTKVARWMMLFLMQPRL